MSYSCKEDLSSEGVARLTLEGRLNAVVAPQLKARLKELVRDGYTDLVLDFAEVSFVDSSGLAALVSGFRAAREAGGTLKLACLKEQTLSVFKLTRLDRVFEMYPDVSSALSS